MVPKKIYRPLAILLTAACTLTLTLTVGADEDTDNGYYYTDNDYEYTDDGNNDDNGYNDTDNNDNTYDDTDDNENDDNTDDNETADTEQDDDAEAFNEDTYQEQQASLEEENRQLQEKLQITAEELQKKRQTVKDLQAQIADLHDRISASNKHILTLNDEITEKQKLIEEKSAEIEEVLALLRIRLRNIHTAGDTTSLEIILGAKDFADFLDKAEMVKSMSDYDTNLIHSIEDQAALIAAEQKALREKKLSVEAEKAQLEKDKKAINQLLEENTKLVESLMTDQKKLQNEQKDNEAKQEDLEKAWEAHLKRQEEEKQRQEELERLKSRNVMVVPRNGDKYVWPCPGFTYLTSTFDEWRGVNNHGALDIAEAGIYGAQVVACYDGIVFSTYEYCEHDWGKDTSCGCGGGYGNYVMIDHGNGKSSIYGHLSGVTVEAGQTVKAGQLIGFVGSTGFSTGAHLHFETRYNNVRYDPLTEY